MTLTPFLSSFIDGALVSNPLLISLLGLSLLLSTAQSRGDMLLLSSLMALAIILVAPVGFAFLSGLQWLGVSHSTSVELTITAVLAAAVAVPVIAFMRDNFALTYRRCGAQLVFALLGTATLGVCFLSYDHALNSVSPWSSLFGYSIGAGLGLTAVALALNALQTRLDTADVPVAFRGTPLQLLSLGMAAMAFLGLAGLA